MTHLRKVSSNLTSDDVNTVDYFFMTPVAGLFDAFGRTDSSTITAEGEGASDDNIISDDSTDDNDAMTVITRNRVTIPNRALVLAVLTASVFLL